MSELAFGPTSQPSPSEEAAAIERTQSARDAAFGMLTGAGQWTTYNRDRPDLDVPVDATRAAIMQQPAPVVDATPAFMTETEPEPEGTPPPPPFLEPDESPDEEPEPEEPEPEEPEFEPSTSYAVDEYDDPQTQALKRELAKQQRQLEHERRLRVSAGRKNWAAEAKKLGGEYISQEELSGIGAQTHRAYIAEAKRIMRRNYDLVARVTGQAQPAVQVSTEAQMREQIRAEERERAAQAWGRPSTGTAGAGGGGSGGLEQARRGGLEGSIGWLLRQGR